ncbi:MAG: TlpA family protein disulfide reductase [Gammaproteobacteria bacterium]|nr:TlpA family protein disulfide reductase [Gammaproteobacteria bacterium]
MPRVMLVFATALVALMAGALFYAARIPTQIAFEQAPQPVTLEVVTHPAFTLPDIEGVDREFAEWDGTHRLINFWATWCAPCRREIPLLKAFQDEYGEAGFQIIGIAVDFPDLVAPFAEEAEFNYPILTGQQDAMAVAELSGVEFIGMPFTMIVARDGELLSAYLGELHQSHLDDIVTILSRLDRAEITSDQASAALDLL